MHKKLQGKLLVFSLAALLIAPAALHGQNNYKWSYKIPGVDWYSCQANGISLDGKGNSYIVGQFSGTASFSPLGNLTSAADSNLDIFIVKADPTGMFQWRVQGQGPHWNDNAKSVVTYPNGTGGVNVYVTGFFYDSIVFGTTSGNPITLHATSGGADTDMFIVKYSDLGVIQWAKRVGNATANNVTMGYDIEVNNDGPSTVCIWVAGSYTDTMSFGASPYNSVTNGGSKQNAFLARYTDGGSAPSGVDWVVCMKSGETAQAEAIDVDDNGNAFVTGYWKKDSTLTFNYTTGSPVNLTPYGGDDGFVAKYTAAGAYTSSPIHFGRSSSTTYDGTAGEGIAVAKDGYVYVTGVFKGPSGDNCTFPNSNSLQSAGLEDGFLLKLDNSATTVQWVRDFGGTGDDDGERVVVDNCGERCYVIGDFQGTCSFVNSYSVGVTGITDAFIADFDASNGYIINLSHAGHTQSTGYAYANDLAINSVEDIQYCGVFSTVSSTNPLASTTTGWINCGNITGFPNGFFARWDDSGWPTLEATAKAVHQGVSVVDCVDYAVGDMTGSSVTFGNLTAISSSQTNNNSNYTSDIYLLATDKYATLTSATGSFVRLTSGTSAETCKDIVSDASYHYVAGSAATGSNQDTVKFVGNATNSFTSTLNTSHAIVIKTNLAGTVQWATSIHPKNGSGYAYGTSVAYDASGNVYFCGYFKDTIVVYNAGLTTTGNAGTIATNGKEDVFVVMYNSSGAVQWKKNFGGIGDDRALTVCVDPSASYYYIAGFHSNTATFAHSHTATTNYTSGFVMKGSISTGAGVNDGFTSTAGTFCQINDIYATSETDVYGVGVKSTAKVQTASVNLSGTTSPTSFNWYLNSSGGPVTGTDIILGSNGYIYISGGIGSSTTITFGSKSVTSSSGGGAYMVGMTGWGGTATWITIAYLDASECNGIAEDYGFLSEDHGFNALFVGKSTASKAFIQKATEEGLEFSSRYGNNDPFGSNLMEDGVATPRIYPNPFNSTATLNLQSSIDPSVSPVSLMIIDMTGRMVKRIDGITTQETIIQGDDLVNGIYFYQVVQDGNVMSTGKMMINR